MLQIISLMAAESGQSVWGMHTSTEAWAPGERGDPHFGEWNSASIQFGEGSFDLNSLSKI